MRTSLITFSLFFILHITCYAQSKQSKFNDRFEDAFEEEENQNLTLRFFNALDGEPISNALITIEGSNRYKSDDKGKIRFSIPQEDGFVHFKFEKDQFITSDFKIEVIAGTLFSNRFSVSPKLNLNDIRIVLDWEASPKDLDAHFIKKGGYHISYRNTRILADGNGELDRDDKDGYGPETITISNVDDLGEYTYTVHDYTNQNNARNSMLTKSRASVKVFGEGKLLYVFTVPEIGTGTHWEVFKILEGDFISINTVKN